MRYPGAEARPNRRGLLRAVGAIAATGVLGGCTADVGEDFPANEHWPVSEVVPDLPIEQRTDVLENGIRTMARRDIDDLDGFERALAQRDVEFVSVDRSELLLELVLVETASRRSGVLTAIGLVTGSFAALVGSGFDVRALELTVLVPDRSTVGVAEVAASWVNQFRSGTLTAAEVGELVAATIESQRRPPSLDVGPEESANET